MAVVVAVAAVAAVAEYCLHQGFQAVQLELIIKIICQKHSIFFERNNNIR